MRPSEVQAEAVVGDAIAMVSAALRPGAMFVVPVVRVRLVEAGAHLSLVLRYATVMNAAVRRAVVLHTAVVSASIALLRRALVSV